MFNGNLQDLAFLFLGKISPSTLALLSVLCKDINEPHDKTNKMVCAPRKDSDQPGHAPSLIRVFVVRIKKACVLSYPLSAQQRLWSDWAVLCKDINEPHDKTNKMVCVPRQDSDQPGHAPSLIRVFVVRIKKACVLSYPLSAQQRLWSDWADAQADLSLPWAHSHFVGFLMRQLKCYFKESGW